MIKNEVQYRSAKLWVKKGSEDPQLKKDIQDYEFLRSGQNSVIALHQIEDLPKALIQARIAAGLSQRELALKLRMKPQQLQRYEATNYRAASMDRIHEIMTALGLALEHPAELRLVS
jgi:HTH-type transcriptional regulator/antitoxin HigA